MISSMYQRRMKVAFVLSTVLVLFGVTLIFVDQPNSADDWMNLISIGLGGVFMLVVAIVNRNRFITVKKIHVPESKTSILDLNHLVLKKDIGFFPGLLLFEKNGHFIGNIRSQRVPIILYPISLLFRDSLLMMLPVSYGIISNEGSVLASFKRKGIKKSTVTITNAQGQKIGEYVQDDLKSMLIIKGKLKDENGNTILPVEIKGFSGDFTLTDSEGRRWAEFYNGYFPHEYTKLFRDIDNDIVNLSDDLSEQQKLLLIAMIGFIFLERSR